MVLLTIIIILCVIIFFYQQRNKKIRDKLQNVPEVDKIPWFALFSHVFDRNKTRNFKLYHIVENLINKYDDICFGFVGPLCVLDIRKPEYIKIILNSDKAINRAKFYWFPYKTGLLASNEGELQVGIASTIINSHGKKCVCNTNLDLWRRHRKLLNPAFSATKLNKFLPIVNQKARKLLNKLDEFVDTDQFNVFRLLSALTLESLLMTSFGLDRNFIENPHDEIFTIVKKEASEIGQTISNYFNVFLPTWRKENDFTKFSRDILKKSEENFSEISIKNPSFIEILLQNREILSDLEIEDEVGTMILAGNASTALTMSSILLMLAMHPEVQNQVYEEIILCINDDDDDITPENISKLETLDLVIKETMRLFPVAPIIGREISEDLQLDEGIILPKGVDIGIRIFDIHRNPAIWGLDSNQFKPERFKDLSKIHPYSFLPFSLGQRNCIGFKYATNTIRIVLSHILRKFEISTPLKYDELQLEISFVLRISQSYIIQIKRR